MEGVIKKILKTNGLKKKKNNEQASEYLNSSF